MTALHSLQASTARHWHMMGEPPQWGTEATVGTQATVGGLSICIKRVHGAASAQPPLVGGPAHTWDAPVTRYRWEQATDAPACDLGSGWAPPAPVLPAAAPQPRRVDSATCDAIDRFLGVTLSRVACPLTRVMVVSTS